MIRALNECTGRLFRATIRHNHKSSDMQSKKISNDQELIKEIKQHCPTAQNANVAKHNLHTILSMHCTVHVSTKQLLSVGYCDVPKCKYRNLLQDYPCSVRYRLLAKKFIITSI